MTTDDATERNSSIVSATLGRARATRTRARRDVTTSTPPPGTGIGISTPCRRRRRDRAVRRARAIDDIGVDRARARQSARDGDEDDDDAIGDSRAMGRVLAFVAWFYATASAGRARDARPRRAFARRYSRVVVRSSAARAGRGGDDGGGGRRRRRWRRVLRRRSVDLGGTVGSGGVVLVRARVELGRGERRGDRRRITWWDLAPCALRFWSRCGAER